MLAGFGEHDEIIGIADQDMLGVEQCLVKRIEIQVRQHRRYRAALWNTLVRHGQLVAILNRRGEPLFHQVD